MNDAAPRLSDVLQDADLLFDRASIESAIRRMADAMGSEYVHDVPVFLTVMHGALPFAGQLALELGARGVELEFDYLHATRYRGDTRGGELTWKHRPATSLQGRRVLLVDDILDEGHTLAGVRDWCLQAGADEVRVAVLAVKSHDRCVPGLRADYQGLEVPDRYVFGYGMDFHEQGRNLPAIYALGD